MFCLHSVLNLATLTLYVKLEFVRVITFPVSLISYLFSLSVCL